MHLMSSLKQFVDHAQNHAIFSIMPGYRYYIFVLHLSIQSKVPPSVSIVGEVIKDYRKRVETRQFRMHGNKERFN